MREACPDCRVLTSNAPDPCDECAAKKRRLYESILDGLRRAGWDRIEAENEAYNRVYK